MVTDVFIKRPVLATVCSVLITLAGAISNPLPPDDDQVQTSSAPARRLVTVMRSATMNAE